MPWRSCLDTMSCLACLFARLAAHLLASQLQVAIALQCLVCLLVCTLPVQVLLLVTCLEQVLQSIRVTLVPLSESHFVYEHYDWLV